ncbi:hypothetical protein NESM_000123300 [Novymonas esmeraldas]|uniref:Uncharacterized protein n=1 Tax=Novymonas esmeraldas TaxID=1808958 RepID=A0AAW0F351_9TRYP
MHHSPRLFSASKALIADYIEYLRQVDKELPSLNEIFPKSGTVEDVIAFHTSLCAAMEENAYSFIGIKVLPPGHEAVATLRATKLVCLPVFSNFFQRKSVSVKQDRLQYVEGVVCLEVRDLLEGCGTVDGATHNTVAFAPGIAVSGSRFPFYAPTISAMACDLDGCVSIAKGANNSLDDVRRDVMESTRFVLTLDQEPIQTGSLKMCADSPYTVVAAAAAYAKAIKAPARKSSFVFCSGVCPRTPIQAGTYAFEWGRWGRLKYSVLP